MRLLRKERPENETNVSFAPSLDGVPEFGTSFEDDSSFVGLLVLSLEVKCHQHTEGDCHEVETDRCP